MTMNEQQKQMERIETKDGKTDRRPESLRGESVQKAISLKARME